MVKVSPYEMFKDILFLLSIDNLYRYFFPAAAFSIYTESNWNRVPLFNHGKMRHPFLPQMKEIIVVERDMERNQGNFCFQFRLSEITHFSASSFVLSRRFHLDLKNVIWLLCHKYSFNEYSSCSHSIVLELMTILILMIMAMELVILMVGDGSLVPGIL